MTGDLEIQEGCLGVCTRTRESSFHIEAKHVAISTCLESSFARSLDIEVLQRFTNRSYETCAFGERDRHCIKRRLPPQAFLYLDLCFTHQRASPYLLPTPHLQSLETTGSVVSPDWVSKELGYAAAVTAAAWSVDRSLRWTRLPVSVGCGVGVWCGAAV